MYCFYDKLNDNDDDDDDDEFLNELVAGYFIKGLLRIKISLRISLC